jgi:hypothetical protein
MKTAHPVSVANEHVRVGRTGAWPGAKMTAAHEGTIWRQNRVDGLTGSCSIAAGGFET